MKRIPFQAFILLLLLPSGVSAGELRVMTWNLKDMDIFDGAGSRRVEWQQEAEKDIASVIRSVNPDILFITEGPSMVELESFIFRNSLTYEIVHYRQQAGRRDFADNMAVLHRLEVLESRLATPMLPGSTRSEAAAYLDWSYRGIVAVHFDELSLVGVHLKSSWDGRERSYRLRDGQARSLLEFIDGIPGPMVVLGDFNDSPGRDSSEVAYGFSDTIGLLDSVLFRAPGDEITQEKGFNVDHIFVRDSTVGSRRIEETDWLLSDHRPVWADIRF